MTLPPTASPPTRTRLAACGLLAIALNAAAIGLALQASPRPGGVVELQGESAPRSATMQLVPVARAAVDAMPGRPATTPILAAAPAAMPPAARTVAPILAEASPQPVMFYGFREVDTPAFPVSDWNLDNDALDAIGAQRLVFEALVDDRGAVVGCTVVEPADLSDTAKLALEQRISATRLLPALRAGVSVASVRRIELRVDTLPLPTALPLDAASPARRS